MPSTPPPSFVHEPSSSPLDAATVARALRREWRLVLAMGLLALALATAYVLLRPAVYEATGYAFVHTEEASGSAGAIESVLLQGSGQSRTLANELGVLSRSAELAERAVVRVGAERVAADLGLPGTAPGELAHALLNGRVLFDQAEDDIDIISISARTGDPQLAADLVNAFAAEYQERSRMAGRDQMAGSAEFLEAQLSRQRDELQQIEGDLKTYMERNRAVALDTEGETAVSQLASLDAALQQATVDLDVERTALAGLRREAARVEPGLARRVGSTAENEIAVLQRRVAELDAQATDYYAYDPTLRGNEARNPELGALHTRRNAAQARLDALSSQYVTDVMAVGGADSRSEGGDLATTGLPYLTRVQREVTAREIAARGLEARRTALQSQRARYEGRLGSLPARTLGLAQLERSRRSAEQAYYFLAEKLEQARVAAQGELAYVEVVRPALVPERPVAPDPGRTLPLALLLGLVGGAGLALVRRSLDRRLRTPAEVEALGLPLLGALPALRQPDVRDGADAAVLAPLPASGPLAEALRTVRTALQFSRSVRPRVVLVSSASVGEGKTTVAAHLALSAAQAGLRTLYVDADLRRPAGHLRFGIARTPGLGDLLADGVPRGEDPLRLCHPPTEALFEASRRRLFVLPAGHPVPNSPELLGGDRTRPLFDRLRASFDLIVVDTPPVGAVVDALQVAPACDGVVLVASAGVTDGEALRRTGQAFERLGGGGHAVLGVVLNRAAEGSVSALGYGAPEPYPTLDLAPLVTDRGASGDGQARALPYVQLSGASSPAVSQAEGTWEAPRWDN